MMFGLNPSLIEAFRSVFSRYPAVGKVLVYGSRSRGDANGGSDIDLAVMAPALREEEFTVLWAELDALPHIFKLDIVWLEKLDNQPLKTNILRDGKEIYPCAL